MYASVASFLYVPWLEVRNLGILGWHSNPELASQGKIKLSSDESKEFKILYTAMLTVTKPILKYHKVQCCPTALD